MLFTGHLPVIDVLDWDVDFCVSSAYKFFGPHVGLFWGKKKRLEELIPYKLRASPSSGQVRIMTGTQNIAAISGVRAAIDYVASIGLSFSSRHTVYVASRHVAIGFRNG